MQTALFNKFDRKFKELERRTGGDPSRIEWLVRNCPDVRRLVGTLYFWDAEFGARLIDRTHLEVYPWFISRYREFRQRYLPRILAVYGMLHLDALGQDEVDGIPAEEILHPEGPRADSETRFQYFMPGIRGEAEAIELVFRWAYVSVRKDVESGESSVIHCRAPEWRGGAGCGPRITGGNMTAVGCAIRAM